MREREREREKTVKTGSVGSEFSYIYYSSHHLRGRDLKRKKEINLLCMCACHS